MAQRGSARHHIGFVISLCLLILTLASILPWVETNVWWIRYLDFVRIQIFAGLMILMILWLVAGAWRSRIGLLAAAAAVLGGGYHVAKLYPYFSVTEDAAIGMASCDQGSAVRIMIANVQKTNHHSAELKRLVSETAPDVLLLMETNEWWDEQISDWSVDFPYKVQHIPEEATFFGMHVLSKFPLMDPQTRFYFGADTPTILSGVQLSDSTLVQFVGVHPRPPLYWSQPTTLRDGAILQAALDAREAGLPTVVAGDLNATPWERVTRRAIRIGGLLDPRVGRGIYPTYQAAGSLFSWPLDQILFQEGFGLVDYRVLADFGSDHLPVVAELCNGPGIAARQRPAALREDDLEEARTSIEAARELDQSPQ